jgi:hypothetical protein
MVFDQNDRVKMNLKDRRGVPMQGAGLMCTSQDLI